MASIYGPRRRSDAGGRARRAGRVSRVDRLELLNQRTRVVEQIGRVKRAAKLPIYEPRREDQVFDNITTHNGGPLTPEAVKRIFERIIDEMRTIQRLRMEAGRDSNPEQLGETDK